MLRSLVPLFLFAVAGLGGPACASSSKTAGPPETASPVSGDGIADLEARLDEAERELTALGVKLPLGELQDTTTADAAEAEAPASEAPPAEAPASAATPDAAAEARPHPERKSRAKRDSSSRCTRICALSRSTCELAAQICKLAEGHPDELRYSDACHRAEDQCREASTACSMCTIDAP